MFFRLTVGLVLLSLTELILFIWYTRMYGAVPLTFWAMATALSGLFLVKRTGTDPWIQFKQSLWRGKTPDAAVLNRLVLLLAGFCLMIPGLATDVLGFFLLLPGTRKFILAVAPGLITRMMDKGDIRLLEWRSQEEHSDENSRAVS